MRILLCDNGLEVVCLDDEDNLTDGYMKKFSNELRHRFDWLYSTHRDRVCMVCKEPFVEFDLHHSIVSRRDVQGWKPKKRRRVVDVELNFIPLHNWCHLQRPPTRDVAWEYQSEFYGEEIMRDWYYALPFKVFPRRF